MINAVNILKTMRMTEKTAMLSANHNQYTFEVFPETNRGAVKAAVESFFDVKVSNVNILRTRGKRKRSRTVRGAYGRTVHMKKAIVTLQAGDSIDLA